MEDDEIAELELLLELKLLLDTKLELELLLKPKLLLDLLLSAIDDELPGPLLELEITLELDV